jgi:hypothetical protein
MHSHHKKNNSVFDVMAVPSHKHKIKAKRLKRRNSEKVAS